MTYDTSCHLSLYLMIGYILLCLTLYVGIIQ